MFAMADDEGREMGRREDNGRRDEEEEDGACSDDGDASVPFMNGLAMFTRPSGRPSPCPSALADSNCCGDDS